MAQHTEGTEAARYRAAAFEHAAVPLLIFDLDTRRCVEANDAAGQAYGYETGEWKTVSLSDIYEAHGQASLEARLGSLGAAHAEPPDIVVQRRRDGSSFPALASLALIDGDQGRHVLLSVQDVTQQRDLQAELTLTREHCTLAQEHTGSGYCIFDLKRGRQSWSEQQYRNLGLQADSVPVDPARAIDALVGCVLEHDRGRAAAEIHACVDTGMPFDTEWRVRWPDGGEHIVRIEGIRKDDAEGAPYAFVCTSLDLTGKRHTEETLRQTRIDLSLAQQIAQVGTWMVDFSTGKASTTSEETRKIFGIDDFEVPLAVLNSRIHPDDLAAVETARNDCLAHPGTVYYVQYRVVPRPGELRYVESHAEVQADAAGKPRRMVGYLRDITEAKLAEQEIHRLAYHDEVTGLPNRVALRRQLERLTSVDAPDFTPLALVVIDVSRFQDICLTLGHSNSDALLKDVAVRIVAALGDEGHVARIGNAQFAAILSDARTYASQPCARTILKAFEEPFKVADIQYNINVNIGIALCPGHAADPITLMRKAIVAVFQARQTGTNVLVYQPEDDPYKPERLALLGEFRKAIQDGQIELYCQPKVEMRTNDVIGAEALVRWRHPRLGMVSPALFVPLVEDTELIHVLTHHVLHASVRQCFNWRRDGLHVPLAVNISPRNLLSHDLVPILETLLHTWGGNPDWLGLEITESSLITDPDASIAELAALSRMGFRLFIDDFGTGYSSLSYLTRMPVNVIKVDHGFTMRMLEDKRAAMIVKSTIELAHNLGMTVVAEGTSSKEIWDALSEYGCDEVQGYYVAEPFPAAEFSAWLQATGRHVRPHVDPASMPG
jgi:diguanylate cyclase (GGDEF)-like protein/PAS domain S-box-containing protein